MTAVNTAPTNGSSASWSRLPADCNREVFKYLTAAELCMAGRVCKNWTAPASDQKLWYTLVLLQSERGTSRDARAINASAEAKRAAIQALAPATDSAPNTTLGSDRQSSGSSGAVASASASVVTPAARAMASPNLSINWKDAYRGRANTFTKLYRSRAAWRRVLGIPVILLSLVLCVVMALALHDVQRTARLNARAVAVRGNVLNADLYVREDTDSNGETTLTFFPAIEYAFAWGNANQKRVTGQHLYPPHALLRSEALDEDSARELVDTAKRSGEISVWVDPSDPLATHYVIADSVGFSLFVIAACALAWCITFSFVIPRRGATAAHTRAADLNHRVFVNGIDRGLHPVMLFPPPPPPPGIPPAASASASATAPSANGDDEKHDAKHSADAKMDSKHSSDAAASAAPVNAADAATAPAVPGAAGAGAGAGGADGQVVDAQSHPAAIPPADGGPIAISDWLLPVLDTLELDQSKQTVLHMTSIAFSAVLAVPVLLHQCVFGSPSDQTVALPLLLVVGMTLWLVQRRWQATRQLSAVLQDASVYAPTRSFWARDRANPLVLRQCVNRDVRIVSVSLTVQCWERYEARGAQGEQQTRLRQLYNRVLPLVGPCDLQSGDALLASCAISVPLTARLTFDGPGLPQFYWQLRIITQAEGLPEYSRDVRIEVRATP